MNSNVILFNYKNLKGEENKFTISVHKVFKYHFSGMDIETDKYRTFRKDRVVEYFDNTEDVLDRYPVEEFKISGGGNKTFGINTNNPDKLLEVCFTGFKKADKERLTALALENNLYVAKDVTVNLGILVCGYNAGPKKIERAVNSAMKVEIMDETEFLHFLETGEVQADLDQR